MSAVALSTLAFVVALAAFFRALFDRFESKREIIRVKLEAQEAKRLLLLRTQLASEIAHEIKNPMTAVISSVEAIDLLIGNQIDPELQKSLHYIKESGDYMLRLLTDFLEVNKLRHDSAPPNPEKVSVGDCVESVAGLLRAYALRKHISLVATGLEKKLCAWVDSRHLKQILFNLVHNALKFTPDRGAISISVSEDLTAPRIRFIIQDTGPGIPEDELQKLFEPFVQGSVKNTDDSGIGLGLALCRRLVRESGGDIMVTSAQGIGTAFEFWIPKFIPHTEDTAPRISIPIIRRRAQPDTSPEPALYQPLIGQAFLIVDENSQSRDSIAKLIEAWGGIVDQVSQAIEAVEALAHRNYDAVMVDNTADGLLGHELAVMLKEQAHQKGTTIILASREPVDENLAHEYGVDKCVEKPLKGDDLLRSLIPTGKFQITH